MATGTRSGIRRPLILAVLSVLGVAAISFGWASASRGFVSSLLLEMGAGLFLFAALLVLEGVLERRIEEVSEESSSALRDVNERVNEVEQGVADVKESVARLDEVGGRTREALKARRDAIDEAFAGFDEAVSPTTVTGLLREAERVEAVSRRGVRVRIGGSHYRLRISMSGNPVETALAEMRGERLVKLTLETPNGRESDSITWVQQDVGEVMATLVERLQVLGEHRPDFDAEHLLRKFRDTVRTAIEAKTTFEAGPGDLGPVIEIPGSQWAITEWGLECLDRYYTIEKERFSEDDWLRHMREKYWVDFDDFDEALGVGRQMYTRELEELAAKQDEAPF